jgi:hypothetical protein
LWEIDGGHTTSQITNSWDLEILVEALDTTFLPRRSHAREMMAQIRGWFRSRFWRCRMGLRDVFEIRHDRKKYTQSILLFKNKIEYDEEKDIMRNKTEKKKGRDETQQWGQY